MCVKEWNNSNGDLDAVYECLVRMDELSDNDMLLTSLDRLVDANLKSQRRHLGSRRITNVDSMLCEQPRNY